MEARPLHWCLKISNRKKSIDFYNNKLEMIVLRHEEFSEGCEATCNGPYRNRWSKTMIGYGDEISHFILELTFNYTVNGYNFGNDYNGIVIESTKLFDKLSSLGKIVNNVLFLYDPDNYPVQIVKGDSNKIIRIELKVSCFKEIDYWSNVLGMKEIEKKDKYVDLVFKDGQIPLRLIEIGEKIEHKTGYGRIAFATPIECLEKLNQKILASKDYKFRHKKVQLGTPGKQTVTVIVLLSYPDEYEICIVNDEDYSVLSKTDLDAKKKLEIELIKEAKKNA